MTTTELLNQITTTYYQNKAASKWLPNILIPEAKEITLARKFLESYSDSKVSTYILKNLICLFSSALSDWDPSKKSPARLTVLPALVNELLIRAGYFTAEDTTLHFTLMDIYEAVSPLPCFQYNCIPGNASNYFFPNISGRDHICLFVHNNKLSYFIKNKTGETVGIELKGKQYDTIKAKVITSSTALIQLSPEEVLSINADIRNSKRQLFFSKMVNKENYENILWEKMRTISPALKEIYIFYLKYSPEHSTHFLIHCRTLQKNHALMDLAILLEQCQNNGKSITELISKFLGYWTAYSNGLLTTENNKATVLKIIRTTDEKCSTPVIHFNRLEQARVLTNEDKQWIIDREDCTNIITLLYYLHQEGKLTPVTRTKYINDHFLSTFTTSFGRYSSLLDRLKKKEILAANIEFVLDNMALLCQDAIYNKLKDIPDHLFTQFMWNTIKRLIEAGEGAEILAYLDDVLNPRVAPAVTNPAAPPRRVNNQTTHAASVEGTAASSLRRLEKLYSLTDEQINTYLAEFEQFAQTIQSQPFIDHLGAEICESAKKSADVMIALAKKNQDKETHTQFSAKKIVALIWTAVTDEANHNKAIELNAKENLINALYNIHADAYSGPNTAACFNGKVYGLVNGLNYIHRAVKIILIEETAIAEITMVHARKIFGEHFDERMLTDADFKQKILTGENTEYDDPELKAWIEVCLQKTAKSVCQYCETCMKEADASPTELMDEIQHEGSLTKAIEGLRTNQYILSDTHEKYRHRQILNFITEYIRTKVSHMMNAWKSTWDAELDREAFSVLLQWMTDKHPKAILEHMPWMSELETVVKEYALTLNMNPTEKIAFEDFEDFEDSEGKKTKIKRTRLITFTDYIDKLVSRLQFNIEDPALKDINFILNISTNASDNDIQKNAVNNMQQWIREHYKPTSVLNRNIIRHFVTIYQIEQRLVKNPERLLSTSTVTQDEYSVIMSAIQTCYQKIGELNGTKMICEVPAVLNQWPQLEITVNQALRLSSYEYEQIENFFTFWFIEREEKNMDRIRELYAMLLDEKNSAVYHV